MAASPTMITLYSLPKLFITHSVGTMLSQFKVGSVYRLEKIQL